MIKFLKSKNTKYFVFLGIPLILVSLLFLKTGSESKALFEDNKRLKKSLKAANVELERLPKLSDYQVSILKKKGLKKPTQDLIRDLKKQKKLIPYKGVLGGNMNFYSDDALILSPKWVFAIFEDGHIGGYMLLEYDIQKNGKISWKVIDSHLEN